MKNECLTKYIQGLYAHMENEFNNDLTIALSIEERKMFNFVADTTILNLSKACNCYICHEVEDWMKEENPTIKTRIT